MSAELTSPETVTGWRVWHVDPAPGAVLRSWSQPQAWPERQRLEARCRTRLGMPRLWSAHRTPLRGHSCGIYACRSREQAEDLLAAIGPVGPAAGRLAAALGRVSLWGHVIENTGGWRGQFAYPYDLLLFGGDRALAAELRSRYAVEVSLA